MQRSHCTDELYFTIVCFLSLIFDLNVYIFCFLLCEKFMNLCVFFSLEVTLQKRSEGPHWTELVLGDRRGQFIMDEDQAAQINQRLTHLTSEELVGLVLSFSLTIIMI